MEPASFIAALGALAQSTRLDIYRTVATAGRDGMQASEIARALEIAPNFLSRHFAILTDAGLLSRRSAGRTVTYSVERTVSQNLLDEMRAVLR